MGFLLAQAMEKLTGCQKMAALGSHFFLVKKWFPNKIHGMVGSHSALY